jgi:hypothetical protein
LPASPATPSALTSSCPTSPARRFSHACRALRSKPWRKLPHQAQGHPLGGRRSGEQRRQLFDEALYDIGAFGFLIDEARDRQYTGPSSFIDWAEP